MLNVTLWVDSSSTPSLSTTYNTIKLYLYIKNQSLSEFQSFQQESSRIGLGNMEVQISHVVTPKLMTY